MADTNELEQAVVDETPEPQATPGAEGADAQAEGSDDDYLDKLLSQYSEETQPSSKEPETSPEQASLGASDDTLDRLSLVEQRLHQEDLAKVIDKVRGDIPKDAFSDEMVEGWLMAMARKKEGINEAWDRRFEDPKRLENIVNGLSKELSKHFSNRPDAGLTEDRDAVAQAVRGSSTKAPEEPPPDFSNMSDQEYANAVEKEFGFRPV